MKPNTSKCHLLIRGHKFEVMLCKNGNYQVIETHLTKPLGIKIESELTFNKHMDLVCKKASQKLNVLSRMYAFIPCDKRKMLVNAFFSSQFSFSPLVWMFHNRRINAKINNLHCRALFMVYWDEVPSFEELLRKDGSVTVHHRNLHSLAIEMYKVLNGIGPVFMNEIFVRNGSMVTGNLNRNSTTNLIPKQLSMGQKH